MSLAVCGEQKLNFLFVELVAQPSLVLSEVTLDYLHLSCHLISPYLGK